MRAPHAVLFALVATAGLVAMQRPVMANCGAEGCPIMPNSPESTFGRYSFNLGYLSSEQSRSWDGAHEISADEALALEGGLGHVVEQLTRTRSWTLDARAQVTERLQLSLSLPYIDRVHRHALAHHTGYFIESEWHMTGVGDASALVSWTLLRATTPTSGALVLQAGVKLPTGVRNVAAIGGEQPEPPARPGSGSTDALIGAQYRRAFHFKTFTGLDAMMPLSAGVSARLNGRGTDEYRSGNEWLASVGSAYPLTHSVRLLAQVSASAHARDEVGTTDAEPHSTGSGAVFATPGLQAEIVPGVSAFANYQFRLYQHTNGPQLVSPYRLSFGLGYSLGR